MTTTENEKIFVRKIKKGYLATYNGVVGKATTLMEAITRAKQNYDKAKEKEELK